MVDALNIRALHTFHGGIVLEHHKNDSLQNGLKKFPVPEKLYINLETSRGQYAAPVVEIGDKVLKGQILAEPQSQAGTYVHASSSGTITSITERQTATANAIVSPVIEITTDGEDNWIELTTVTSNPDRQSIIDSIRKAGLVGLGGAGFPTHLKYNEKNQIDTLLVNGAECEPYISCDAQLMLSYPEELIAGIGLMMEAAGAPQAIVAIEDQTGEVLPALNKVLKSKNINNIAIVKIPVIYPTGGEKQLIEVLTGKQVPSGGLPLDLGILVQNTGTIKALADYVYESKPLVERLITVTGDKIANPQNFIIPLGTPINAILKHVNCKIDKSDEVIIGGPMMGFAMPHTDIGVDKTTNCILVLSDRINKAHSPSMPCIRCGECVTVCPSQLLPQQLHWYINGGNLEKAREHHLFDCIECGACSWVCPSSINLVEYYRYAKSELKYLDFKRKKSDAAKERHDNREARLEQIKQERMSKRKHTRRQRSKDPEKIKQELQASMERVKAAKQQKEMNNE